MKTLQQIKESKRVIIIQTDVDGGMAEIHLATWKGTVIWSFGAAWEHVSVAPRQARITPSWDDMCLIKEIFFNDDECVIQYHPPKEQYVNLVPNCLHIWRPVKERLPIPPAIMVGVRPGQDVGAVAWEIDQLGEENDMYVAQAVHKALADVKDNLNVEADKANDKSMEQAEQEDMSYYDGFENGCKKAIEYIEQEAAKYGKQESK